MKWRYYAQLTGVARVKVKLCHSAEVTLRLNEYGVCASGSWGHPLPDAFASRESLLMSVWQIEFVTSQHDVSKVLALIVFRYSATAADSISTFPDPAQ